MADQDKGLTYTPADLAKTSRAPARKPASVDGADSARRDKAWRSLRKLVQAGRSNRQLDKAARHLN